MKSAEEWEKELTKMRVLRLSKQKFVDFIKRIQQDAIENPEVEDEPAV